MNTSTFYNASGVSLGGPPNLQNRCGCRARGGRKTLQVNWELVEVNWLSLQVMPRLVDVGRAIASTSCVVTCRSAWLLQLVL